MVVDDSVVYRKAIARILEATSGVEKVYQASNGKEAIRIFKESPTDLVTLDIEMPLMTGLETLPELLKIKPDAKVVMISSLTKRGASQTMEALSLGACDYVTKEQALDSDRTKRKPLARPSTINSKLSSRPHHRPSP